MTRRTRERLIFKLSHISISNGNTQNEVEEADKKIALLQNSKKEKSQIKTREQRRLIRETIYEEVVYNISLSDKLIKISDIYKSNDIFHSFSYSYFMKIFRYYSKNDNRILVYAKNGVGTFASKK